MLTRLTVFLFLSTLIACSGETNSGSSGSIGSEVNTGIQLPSFDFTEIGIGDYLINGANTLKQIKVISSEERYYQDIYKYVENPPELNFEIGQVLLADIGIRPSSGYTVEIVKLTDARTYLLATVYITEPGSDCVVDDVVTNPHHIIYVPSKLEITVREVMETTEC